MVEPTRRPLGSFERAALLTGRHHAFNVVAVLRLSATPPAAALAATLYRAQCLHPLLRARIAGTPRRPVFEIAETGPIPLRRVPRDDAERWQRIVEEELERGFDEAVGPLARAVLVASPGGGAGEVVLTAHHALIDATGFLTLCRELLTASGAVSPETDRGLPPRPDDLFPAPFRGLGRWPRLAAFAIRQAVDEVRWRLATRGRRRPEVPKLAVCRVRPLELPAEATAALARRARGERVAMVAAVNAALLLAVRDRLYGGDPRPLRYFVFPDLRPRLRPPPPADALGGYLSLLRLTAPMRSVDFWELARDLHRQIVAAFGRGEKFLASLAAPAVVARLLASSERMGSAAVSFTGIADGPDGVDDPRLLALHAFVSGSTAAPEITAQARLFGGRLLWDMVYLEPELDREKVEAVGGQILDRLTAASGG